MYNKKAQSQIITIVLIILLVLAAVVIIWQVIQGTIERGSETIEGTTQCVTTRLSIVSGGTDTDLVGVTVKRGAGSGDIGVVVVLDGTVEQPKVPPVVLNPLETEKIFYDAPLIINSGPHTVEVAAIVKDSKGTDVVCDISAELTYSV